MAHGERVRLFIGSNELSYQEATIELSDDHIVNTGVMTVYANTVVKAPATVTFRKADGSTSFFDAKIVNVSESLLWDVKMHSSGWELHNTPIQQVYKDTSPEDIVKDVINNYTENLVYASTTTSGIVLDDYIADGYLIDVVKDMLDLLLWQLRIDQNDNVMFEPPGNVNNGVVLSDVDTGGNTKEFYIDRWETDAEQIINRIKLIGGFRERSTEETVTGTGTEFVLTYKPQGALKAVVSGSELAPSEISEIDAENRRVVFTSSKTDPTFFYSYNYPVEVNDQDDDSVNEYGTIYQKVERPEILTVTDGRQFTREFLNRYARPPVIAEGFIPYFDFDVQPGERVLVTNSQRSKSQYLIIRKVIYEAHTGQTKLVLGSRPAEFIDWQRGIEDRIKALQKKSLNDGPTIFSRRVYHKLKVSLALGVTFQYNSPVDSLIPANLTAGVPDVPTLCYFRDGLDREIDCSNNARHGVWQGTGASTGSVFDTSGYRLSAAHMNGSDQYCDGTVSPFSADPSVATISCFVKFDSFGTDHGIWNRVFGDGLYPRLYYSQSDDKLKLQYELDGVVKLLEVSSFSSGKDASTWYHVVVTFDATTGATIYVDGTSVGSDTETGTNYDSGSNPPRVGYDSNLSMYMDGWLDEFMVFNKVLSASEITRLSAKNITGSPDLRNDMVLWWSFDNPKLGDRSSTKQTVT